MKLVRNVGSFNFGRGAIADLAGHVTTRRDLARAQGADERVIFVIDQFFRGRKDILSRLPQQDGDVVLIVDTTDEPTTAGIDALVADVRAQGVSIPATIVGFGGGITLDTAKAIANLLTNPGSAADYQGWDLVKNPAVHKIGVPTISGTGAEATRTCVMTNKATGLKLGMNSDFTVFNHLVLDPDLTATVPRDQYFFTGMDAYIHCIEALAGSYRNAVGDAYSHETINLCQKVFLGDDMMSDQSREDLMVASYLGGSAIATSYVGVVHPFSAGLSVVLGIHHCVANCITMRAMKEFYPEAFDEFWTAVDRQRVVVPEGVARGLTDDQYKSLYDSTVVHSKPLTNALGEDYKKTLTFDKVVELFKMM
ncbi:MAG: iron-containing alcohol dehydrogenase [Actinobacteria bacterium]|nr:iron-containing alcohol dehydrogenase [Actinomycetota bacterium]NBY12758.1 iron-containing alcohol dehydrogenase [Actinomycetota bacterium]NCZ91031.1 iron-containing alcohol dehydrogenase [Actinomycetota bacterium]NDF41233.1 iron-containing alcohol dehydrogenase [Actinomycetota bacterium]